jgi:hypothetical protein
MTKLNKDAEDVNIGDISIKSGILCSKIMKKIMKEIMEEKKENNHEDSWMVLLLMTACEIFSISISIISNHDEMDPIDFYKNIVHDLNINYINNLTSEDVGEYK